MNDEHVEHYKFLIHYFYYWTTGIIRDICKTVYTERLFANHPTKITRIHRRVPDFIPIERKFS